MIVYIVLILFSVSIYFNKKTLYAIAFLLPLCLILVFKRAFWMMGLVCLPFAAMALLSSNVYAHQILKNQDDETRYSYAYKSVLILIAIGFVVMCAWKLGLPLKGFNLNSIKDFFYLIIGFLVEIYVISVCIHNLVTYLITPLLPCKTETYRGKLDCFFTQYVVKEKYYCIAFDSDPFYWHLGRDDFKQHVIKQGSTYEYTVCTGFLGNKFIKGRPIIISNIGGDEERANSSNYYPRNLSLVLKWIVLSFVGMMVIVVGLGYQFLLYLLFMNSPEKLMYAALQISASILLVLLGIFATTKGIGGIRKTAKYTHSPIPDSFPLRTSKTKDQITRTLFAVKTDSFTNLLHQNKLYEQI